MKRGCPLYKWALLAVLGLILTGCHASEAAAPEISVQEMSTPEKAETVPIERENDPMKQIEIQIGDTIFEANLYDNETAQAFLELLPLQVDMQELNGNEKYVYLQQSLPNNAESVSSIQTGELMLFGEDCVVLFYEDLPTSYTYTRIGYVQHPEELSKKLGDGAVTVVFRASGES